MAPASAVVDRILRFNAGREPERLALKYRAMCADAFRFFRGTCHLFYEDWPRRAALDRAPPAWICGDLHLENFGAYKGDDRLAYFDLNDFDEAILAPCTWEAARFVTSVMVAAPRLGVAGARATDLCRTYLDAYAAALVNGKARHVERPTAEGLVRDLLASLKRRTRRRLLEGRTECRGGRRRLRVGKRALAVTAEQRRAVVKFFRRFARQEPDPKFFRVLDVARRVAGLGSLGEGRFVVLVEGRGSPDGNYLLDLKEAHPSALRRRSPVRQPAWDSEAQRVVAVQERMQAVGPALLHAVEMSGCTWVLRELQPMEDRLLLERWSGHLRRLERVMGTMGRVTAWSQLRSGGRQGSAIADELIAFGGRAGWSAELLRYGRDYARQVRSDWRAFAKAAEGRGQRLTANG
jgi:uncharacterized protein (DUF2252 family)